MNNLYLIICLFIGGILLGVFFFWLISFVISTRKKLENFAPKLNKDDVNEVIEEYKKDNESFIYAVLQEYKKDNEYSLRTALEEFKNNNERSIQQALDRANKQLIDSNDNNMKTRNTTLEGIINPLKESIKEYKNRSEDLTKAQSQEIGKLQEQLKNVLETHNKLSEETNNLTKALKGNIKIQGNLGEDILKRVLECSGLKKDFNYFEQPTFNSETGKKRPDFIIKLPEGRDIIIDAKLSLNSYLDYSKSSERDKDKCILDMKKAFENHVKSLSPKEYYALDGVNSPKAVLLFIPIESIYLILAEHCNKLFLEAGENNVYVVTATTLMPLLQIVMNMWNIHYRNENAQQMAKIAGKIYDKYAGMLSDIDSLDKALNKAFEEANEKINDFKVKFNGKGGLTYQVECLKTLGADSNKNVPPHWLSECQIVNQVESRENKGE